MMLAAEETEAQQAARRAEVEKVVAEIRGKDPREHLNVVFIGHVDAGKSTCAGQILVLTGGVDDRTMEKYERCVLGWLFFVFDRRMKSKWKWGVIFRGPGWPGLLLLLCRSGVACPPPFSPPFSTPFLFSPPSQPPFSSPPLSPPPPPFPSPPSPLGAPYVLPPRLLPCRHSPPFGTHAILTPGREAKEHKHESWYIAYIMDTNEEERQRGKTVEVGRAFFETPKKRYTILDAPGHKSYVPNMISGAAQADVGVLVISARKGEFETGFERGGQTREHVQLAKTLGVQHLVVVVNKMDDSTIANPDGTWSQDRYDDIEKRLSAFLKGSGYNPKRDVTFLPISGLYGHNLKDPVDPKICPWYKVGSRGQGGWVLNDADWAGGGGEGGPSRSSPVSSGSRVGERQGCAWGEWRLFFTRDCNRHARARLGRRALGPNSSLLPAAGQASV